MNNQAQKHTALVIILFSLMIGWVVIEYNPGLKANLMRGTISFEGQFDKLYESSSVRNNHYTAPGRMTPASGNRQNSYSSGQSSAPQQRNVSSGQSSSGTRYSGVPEGSTGSHQRQSNQQAATRQDGSTTLGQDTRDFARSTYNATRLGFEIMNDDPLNTANKLMYDEEYQQRVLQTGTDLMESSERMHNRANEAVQQAEHAQQQTQQRLNEATRQAEQTRQRANEAARQTQERTQQRVNDLRDRFPNRRDR
jgi:hypothetical protein